MLTIPSTVQALFKTDGLYKNFRVHFPNGEFPDITNDNVVQESVKFTESLCSQSTFKFGLAEASVLEFQTVGIGNMYGMTIEASIEIDCSSLSAAQKTAIASGTWDGTWDSVNEVFSIPYGTFRVESCPRDHQSMAHRQVTAYSSQIQNETINLPTIPYDSKIQVNLNAILGACLGIGITESDSSSLFGGRRDHAALYNSVGTAYELDIRRLDGVIPYNMIHADKVYEYSYVDDPVPFISVDMPSYDADAYEAFGVAVADSIPGGYDLTYNASGSKIYDDNEDALRHCCPWLFKPCVIYTYFSGGSDLYHEYFESHVDVADGELIPIINKKSENTNYNVGFYVDDTKFPMGDLARSIYTVGCVGIAASVGIYLNNNKVAEIADTGYLTEKPTLHRYKLDNRASINLTLNQTSVEKQRFGVVNGSSVAQKIVNKNVWGFSEIRLDSLVTGGLEIYAMFAKTNRLGGFEQIRLDNSSPVSVSPGEYAECWWDEYNVDPIGTVIVTYQNDTSGDSEENTTAITIGSGLSLYDMSDNEVLKNLLNTDLATVTSLINTNFKPYVGAVAFTPTELTMRGLPWIEAGDALQITAEDGTIVNTFALRIEMSGIQHLQAVITAEGGEIIEEVS